MTIVRLTVSFCLLGLLTLSLAMFMQFLAGLNRVQPLRHQRFPPLFDTLLLSSLRSSARPRAATPKCPPVLIDDDDG
jgi:hypothetical protein